MKPALTSHYIVDFAPPPDAARWMSVRSSTGFSGENYSQNQEQFQILCSDASLPGSSLTTNDVNDDYHGVTQKFAYRRLYDTTSDFTFYVDRNYKIISFFEGWLSYIVREENQGGRLYNNNYTYRVRFPKNYKTRNLYITKFEKDTGRYDTRNNLEYQFINAFPLSISSMPVSYDQSQLLKCTVSFSYDRYIMTKKSGYLDEVSQSQRNFETNLSSSTGGGVLSGAGTFEELNSINRQLGLG